MHAVLRTLVLVLALGACTTERATNTPRSVREELLLSNATDRAAQKMILAVPPNSKVFLDTSEFDGVDSKYAIGSIRDSFLRQGILMTEAKDGADVIVRIRAGVLATGDTDFLVGSPAYSIPMPLSAGTFSIPKIALYDEDTVTGVAKFAATGIDRKTGRLVASIEPQYGLASKVERTVLIFISWTDQDYKDPEERKHDPF